MNYMLIHANYLSPILICNYTNNWWKMSSHINECTQALMNLYYLEWWSIIKCFFFAKIFIAFELFDIHTKFSKEGLIIHFFWTDYNIWETNTGILKKNRVKTCIVHTKAFIAHQCPVQLFAARQACTLLLCLNCITLSETIFQYYWI